MKLEKMKKNRAGNYIPNEYAVEFLDEIKKRKDKFPEGFLDGAACALAYLSTTEKMDTYGKTAEEYVINATHVYDVIEIDSLIELGDAKDIKGAENKARKIISDLKARGITVVDAYLVEVD